MQNKKVTMLAAVLAVTVIAMAGVGYAAVTHYSATTENTNNTMNTTYLKLTQNGNDVAYDKDFLTALYFKTENKTNATTFTFTPEYTGNLSGAEYKEVDGDVDNAAKISKDLQLVITPHENSATSISLLVTATNFTYNDKLVYTMIVNDGTTKTPAEYKSNNSTETETIPAGWYFSGITISATEQTTLTVCLVVTLASNVTGLTEAQATSGFPGPTASEKSTFEFKATAKVTA